LCLLDSASPHLIVTMVIAGNFLQSARQIIRESRDELQAPA
jgi:hypothetical protein